MKRLLLVVLASVVLATLAVLLTAAVLNNADQSPEASPLEITGYIVSDLHLISQESRDDWTPEWTAPIQAATILAWLAEHGYPGFIGDLNNDGVIDELDTIELADNLGRYLMGTRTTQGTTDVSLVLGLARYVADQYPDQFILKIYDAGFPEEFATEEGHAFASDIVNGIEVKLEDEPSIQAYEFELESGEGVIVGLEEEANDNTYLSGRSFLYEVTDDGYTPIDLAWSQEDRFSEGHQGKVLETVGKMENRFYLDYLGSWTPVEFMLALSPVAPEFKGSSEPPGCPEDAIAYDVNTTTTRYGSIQVEECVTREGDVDTYTYTVTNIDFLFLGCGFCSFSLPNLPQLPTLSHSETASWQYMDFQIAWVWQLFSDGCGILPGESAVFSVSVPGPTVDVAVVGSSATCQPVEGNGEEQSRVYIELETTGPSLADAGCPELSTLVTDEICVFNPATGNYDFTVFFDVTNNGSVPFVGGFDVSLIAPGSGDDYNVQVPPPGIGVGETWSLQASSEFPPEGTDCPFLYELWIAPSYTGSPQCDVPWVEIEGLASCCDKPVEPIGACCLPDGGCSEISAATCAAVSGTYNGDGSVCVDIVCEQPEETCPDLVLQVTDAICVYNPTTGNYDFTVWVDVTNTGNAPVTSPFPVLLGAVPYGNVWESTVEWYFPPPDFAPLDTKPFVLSLSFEQGEPLCPFDYDVSVDPDGGTPFGEIDECDEENNYFVDTACCTGEPEPECPDLIVEITDLTCSLVARGVWEIEVEAEVTNIGDATVTDAIKVKASTGCDDDTATINTNLESNESDTVNFTLTCSTGAWSVSVEVDYLDSIDECSERNNEDNENASCR